MEGRFREDRYRRLGKKIDGLTVKTPWNETFHGILKVLYTAEEADVVATMPYTLSSLDRIAKVTGFEKRRLRSILDSLCSKGLVMDLWNEMDSQYYYMASPIIIGIFEFTMMRTDPGLDTGQMAKLFHEYLPSIYPANFTQGEKTTIMRVIPVEESVPTDNGLVFLDYERASAIIDDAGQYALGICSCRNEKHHLDRKSCDAPLDNCSMFGIGADYMVRHDLARRVSKSEMIDNFARSKELGLVLCAYNVRKNPTNVCHCCKCCCNFLAGMSKFGYVDSVTTSSFIAVIDQSRCKGCGKCVQLCPGNAISLVPGDTGLKTKALLNEELCVGCGVCASKCSTGAASMRGRSQEVIHPETIFEAAILSTLERGTLQNQLFDNPGSITHQFMRAFVGAFLRLPPVKRALMSDALRSSFLGFMKAGAGMQGKGWITRL